MTAPTFSVLDRVEVARTMFPDDLAAALAYVDKHAIEDIMWLLEKSRVTARYDHTRFARLPAIFERERKRAGDQIWEGQHNWTNPDVAHGTPVTHLDTPASFLNAMNCHLPIGSPQHADDGVLDRKRSGVYRINPPTWNKEGLPPVLGNRNRKGTLWVPRATVQLLADANRLEYCEWDGDILESWTAPSSENILKPLRGWLVDARSRAIADGDKFAEESIKILYRKLVSTMGDSRANFEMRRSDWRHLIRSQAFSNLLRRAWKLWSYGLDLYKVTETDAIHVVADIPADGSRDWRDLWAEGRGLGQMSVKRHYHVGQQED